MIDFCYFANYLIMIYIFCYPQSVTLFRICFVNACGPLLWAIPLYRNSVVFHSLDRITSIYLHMFPALVLYSIRWNDNEKKFINLDENIMDTEFLFKMMCESFCAYFIWIVFYFVFVFIIFNK